MGLSSEKKRDLRFTLSRGGKTVEAEKNSFNNVQNGYDDTGLWKQFKTGNEVAFSAIYKRYIVALYNYGEIITPDKELIEDSIHDLFVELWKKRQSIAQVESVKYYLFKGLKRKIVKNLEKKRKLPLKEAFEDHDFEIVLSHEFGLIAGEITAMQKESILKAINQLSRRQKEVIVLRFYEGMAFSEIAKLLEISQKSTYTLVYRALASMKGSLENILLVLIVIEAFCVSD
ncbi:sigma-70 family RNA polymerase sigma factor [uncultured Cyclobacterium sp.]|uniref:RNA polymerase sigma factor n=1 Tax=uncultured Cyclobacterium sp. TaxID=453820 RepID=UPI0030EDBAD5|tara:strand:- start:30884 stop:31573 length:690 start_codon:yes stop_codon:yes gene_type:complete